MTNNSAKCETPTEQNWVALRHLAIHCFSDFHKQHPDCTLEGLLAAFNLPNTALMHDLATIAGFACATVPTPAESFAVLTQCLNGVHSAELISKQTGVSINKVQRVLDSQNSGFGNTPFGRSSYGSNRAISNGKSTVIRRTSLKGQFSYRGRRYSLGALYRGRTVCVQERERDLLITCNDRSPLCISHYLSR